MTRRRAILVLILAAVLAVAGGWSYAYVADQRRAALAALADLDDCRRMAAQIETLRRRPSLAAQNQRGSAETIGLIEQSAKAAQLASGNLVRILPEPPRRLGDTVYVEKPTRVMLKNVTLQQLVAMVHGIITDKNGLHARSVRLTAPSPEDTGPAWTAELVLTYLIFEPPRTVK